MANEDAKRTDKPENAPVKPPRYRPPGKSSPSSVLKDSKARGVTNVAERIGNMSISSQKDPVGRQVPHPMKAGGWRGGDRGDMFLRRSGEMQHSRPILRKVTG